MWIGFQASFGVKFEGFPLFDDMKAPPLTKNTTAEFNTKDSYYYTMNRQSGTRPFVGDRGYIGLVPGLAEKGDVVVIFRGTRASLREAEKADKGTWRTQWCRSTARGRSGWRRTTEI